MGAKMFNQITASYSEEGLKRWTQAYLACVAAVDDNVGQVMDALNQTHSKTILWWYWPLITGFIWAKKTTYTKIL